jgi:hypothetical protein
VRSLAILYSPACCCGANVARLPCPHLGPWPGGWSRIRPSARQLLLGRPAFTDAFWGPPLTSPVELRATRKLLDAGVSIRSPAAEIASCLAKMKPRREQPSIQQSAVRSRWDGLSCLAAMWQ